MFFWGVRVLSGDGVEWGMVGDVGVVVFGQVGKSWGLSDIEDTDKVHKDHADGEEYKNAD